MNTDSVVYKELNKAWKSTCKILFGEEIGELKDYEKWIKYYLPSTSKKKSYLSGDAVYFLIDDYCDSAKFITINEIKERGCELNVNEIKDIDSIVEAVSEKWEYTGNKVLGNSRFVETSDMILDSHYVMDSMYVQKSSYVFGGAGPRSNSKYIFGSVGGSNCEFIIRLCGGTKLERCFEISYCTDSSDLVFCMNCNVCSDVMFSFNQRNKRYVIGNLELPKDKYLSLKGKLMGEIVDELKKEKWFPSFFDFVSNIKPKSDVKVSIQSEKPVTDMEVIEKAFSSTFKVLFKKETSGIDQYEKWLSRHSPLPKEVVSPLGQTIYMSCTREFPKYNSLVPEKRVIGYNEAIYLADLHLDENDLNSLSSIKKKFGDIAYFCLHFKEGNVGNTIKTGAAYSSSNIYRTSAAINSEYAGISSAVGLNAKYIFGSNRIADSQFCIHCYYSSNLTRCFEVDICTNCADTYFAHNCEGLSDAMFCFNAKAKRYAIGNSQLLPDEYRKIKDSLVEQMADEIIKKKDFKWDIYNIGCYKRG